MAATLLPFALLMEGSDIVHSPLVFQGTAGVLVTSLLATMGGACLAFFLTISEFMLVNRTSGYSPRGR